MGAKMGIALLIISVIIFLKEPFEYLGRYSVWALLIVAFVFDFTIGGFVSKGFNCGLGALSVGGLLLGLDCKYGFRVFLLTYCFIMVSGFSMEEFLRAAVTRLVLTAQGAVAALIVNVFVYPIWAGEDLPNLVVKIFTVVAASFEGCVNGYLQCVDYERVFSKIHTYQASDDPLY